MIEGVLSNRIRFLRFQHGEMSQAELGQRIGVTRQTIAAIEAVRAAGLAQGLAGIGRHAEDHLHRI